MPSTSAAASEGVANQPPPFLTKTYELVDDPSTDNIVSWSSDGTSFVVWKHPEFARDLLPKHFKHNNFSSFVRQLNTYGFRKVDPDRWEFANENFIQGRRDLLREIHRRKPAATQPQPAAPGPAASQPAAPQANGHAAGASSSVFSQQTLVPAHGHAAVEVGAYGGFQQELEGLKRDKNVLMMELVRMRQQQSSADDKIRDLNDRLSVTEQRQQSLINFFATALKDPRILQRLLSTISTAGVQRLGPPAGRKKRRARAEGPTAMDPGVEQLDLELDMLDPDSPELDPFTGIPIGLSDDLPLDDSHTNGNGMVDHILHPHTHTHHNQQQHSQQLQQQLVQYNPSKAQAQQHANDLAEMFLNQVAIPSGMALPRPCTSAGPSSSSAFAAHCGAAPASSPGLPDLMIQGDQVLGHQGQGLPDLMVQGDQVLGHQGQGLVGQSQAARQGFGQGLGAQGLGAQGQGVRQGQGFGQGLGGASSGLPEMMLQFSDAFDSLQLEGQQQQQGVAVKVELPVAAAGGSGTFRGASQSLSDGLTERKSTMTNSQGQLLIPMTAAVMCPPTSGLTHGGISGLPGLTSQQDPSQQQQQQAGSASGNSLGPLQGMSMRPQTLNPNHQGMSMASGGLEELDPNPHGLQGMALESQHGNHDGADLINLDNMTSGDLLLSDILFRDDDWGGMLSPLQHTPSMGAQDAAQAQAIEDVISRMIRAGSGN